MLLSERNQVQMSRKGESVDTRGRLVASRAWEEGKEGESLLPGHRCPFGALTCFGTRQTGWLHNAVNILNVTDLVCFKMLNLMLCEFPLNTRILYLVTFRKRPRAS